MKTRNRSTGNRDTDEWENRSGKDKTSAVDEARQRRHLQSGMNENHSDGERRDRA